MKGTIYSGPDLLKIVLLDKFQFSQINEYSEEQKEEIFSDAYIPPELIKSNLKLSSRVDSWIFGIFYLIYYLDILRYYIQLKEWYESIHGKIYNKEIYNILFLNNKHHIYFNLFSNIQEIMEDKAHFLKALKLKSFLEVVKKII